MGPLGAHVSIAGGLYRALERGDSLGCEAIQIFVQPSRTWKIPTLQKEEIALFKHAVKNAQRVKRIIAHNSYLLNLTSANAIMRKRSIRYFIQTMERCETLGVESLITHPGSHLGEGIDGGIRYTSKSLDEVLRNCKGFRTKLLLENTAGQGDCLGHSFEEMQRIIEGCKAGDRIAFCFDTQHAFAAGWDLRTKQGYEAMFAEWDKRLSLRKIAAFHVNDSTKALGARVDRHQNIGQGFLGAEPFKWLVNDRRFKRTPMCIETEPGDECEKHRADLELLSSFRKPH